MVNIFYFFHIFLALGIVHAHIQEGVDLSLSVLFYITKFMIKFKFSDLKNKIKIQQNTVYINYNPQSHPTFHSEERLVSLLRKRESFVGLTIDKITSLSGRIEPMDELIYCSHRTVYTNQTICWDPIETERSEATIPRRSRGDAKRQTPRVTAWSLWPVVQSVLVPVFMWHNQAEQLLSFHVIFVHTPVRYTIARNLKSTIYVNALKDI